MSDVEIITDGGRHRRRSSAEKLRIVEDLLHERGIDVSHETVRCWWNRFGRYLHPRYAKSGFNSCVGCLFTASRFLT